MANEQGGQKKQEEAQVSPQPKGEEQSLITAQENWKKWSQLIAQAWADKQLKERLVNNPAPVLREHGIEVRPGVDVRVVENTDSVSYLVLPLKPGDRELTPGESKDLRQKPEA